MHTRNGTHVLTCPTHTSGSQWQYITLHNIHLPDAFVQSVLQYVHSSSMQIRAGCHQKVQPSQINYPLFSESLSAVCVSCTYCRVKSQTDQSLTSFHSPDRCVWGELQSNRPLLSWHEAAVQSEALPATQSEPRAHTANQDCAVFY